MVFVYEEKGWYWKHARICWVPYNRKWQYRDVLLAHFDEIVYESWVEIKAGDLIGYSGNTWYSFMNWKEYPNWWGYPHLHWSLRRRNKDESVINYNNWFYGSEDIFEKWRILKNEVSIY